MPSLRWTVATLARPVLRRLPPWVRVRAYHRLVGKPFAHGAMHGRVIRPIEPHGYAMELDLADWMERAAALTGQFYEIEVTALLERLLRPGDCFVDIGGNLGFVSLTARRLIGDGRLIYVEPNPRLVERFAATCARNGIVADIVPAALGERSGLVGLATEGHHGTSMVVSGDDVAMIRADDLPIPPLAPCFVKIDVEGYEELVLRGADALLDRPDCAFLIEITDRWLRTHGGSAASLFETMQAHGLAPWRIEFARPGLRLHPLPGPLPDHQYDVLFARSEWLKARWPGGAIGPPPPSPRA